MMALLIGAAMIIGLGANPLEGYKELLIGAFGGTEELAESAAKAMLLLLVGTGICVAFRAPDLSTTTSSLSGGNIQKLILARELDGEPPVLLAAQPTRGVDIGSAEYIHDRLVAQRARGTAIMVISEDLDEVMAVSDDVAVMYEGRIVAVAWCPAPTAPCRDSGC